jgi:Alpha/beta hydrolase family
MSDRINIIDPRIAIREQLPYSYKIRHHLSLYNPIVWWRAVVMRKRKVQWNAFEIITLIFSPVLLSTAVIRLIQPRRISSTSNSLQKSIHVSTTSERQWDWITALILAIPLNGYLLYKLSLTTHAIWTSMYQISHSRLIAHSQAYKCIQNRIQQNRAYRTYSYDVYMPPTSIASLSSVLQQCSTNLDTTTTATTEKVAVNKRDYILFFPGAFVEHVAYAEPAALLSDHGYIVVVLSSEPLGIVDVQLPQFYVSKIKRIQRDMEQKHDLQNGDTSRCILLGHSMGSLLCTKLIKHLPNVQDIVLWGSAPFLDYMGNISDSNSRVLVAQGTMDQIIQLYSTPEMIYEYWHRLPKATTVLHEIPGGTHHGFANYIWNMNNHNNNDTDDEGSISTIEQHSIAVQVTIDFLRNHS